MDEILRSQIRDGLHKGIITIINNPNDGAVSAQIGDGWFYFAGSEDEYLDAKTYIDIVGEEGIVNMIYNTLADFKYDGENGEEEFLDEWKYYYTVLCENKSDI